MQSMLASPLSILLKGRRWTRQVEVTAFFAGYTSQFRWMAFRGRELWTMEEWSRRYHHKSVTFSWKYSTNSSVVNEGAAVKSTVLETILSSTMVSLVGSRLCLEMITSHFSRLL